jgi:hypothetical protein
MRAIADNLRDTLVILQAMLTIVSTTLTIILFLKVRRLVGTVARIPGDVVRAVVGAPGKIGEATGNAWNRLTGRK